MHSLANRINREGVLLVHSQSHRSQHANKDAARRVFASLLAQALHTPKARRKTRTPAKARRKRLKAKRRRGETKRLRQSPGSED